jgi:hypothetical protein
MEGASRMSDTLRRVQYLGRTDDGRHVFQDLDYPADAPRHILYDVRDVLAHPDTYCNGGQFFSMTERAAAYWGYDLSRPVVPTVRPVFRLPQP